MIAAWLLAVAAPASQGQVFYNSQTTGAVFMEVCKSQMWTPGNYDGCGSYLLGLIDALAIGRRICPRAGVGNYQMQQIAFNYVRDHPEKWDQPAAWLVSQELARLYPCRTGR